MSDSIDDEDDGTVACDWCGGSFVPDDMDGDYCRECAADVLGGEL